MMQRCLQSHWYVMRHSDIQCLPKSKNIVDLYMSCAGLKTTVFNYESLSNCHFIFILIIGDLESLRLLFNGIIICEDHFYGIIPEKLLMKGFSNIFFPRLRAVNVTWFRWPVKSTFGHSKRSNILFYSWKKTFVTTVLNSILKNKNQNNSCNPQADQNVKSNESASSAYYLLLQT